jgi:hypothetical protein
VVFAEGFESLDGRFDHCDVARAEDDVQDLEDIGGVEREVARSFLDERCEDLEGNLDIPIPYPLANFHLLLALLDANRLWRKETYPILALQTSLAVFFSRKAPTFWTLLRRVVA